MSVTDRWTYEKTKFEIAHTALLHSTRTIRALNFLFYRFTITAITLTYYSQRNRCTHSVYSDSLSTTIRV